MLSRRCVPRIVIVLLFPPQEVYCKLRALVDSGCTWVGHGVANDFRILNLHVPASQVVDTVELFRLPQQRIISLRFLAAYLLKADIQVGPPCPVLAAYSFSRVFIAVLVGTVLCT
jgi:hypothetical protein